MAARASTDLVKDCGSSFPPTLQNPSALAVHLSFMVRNAYPQTPNLIGPFCVLISTFVSFL